MNYSMACLHIIPQYCIDHLWELYCFDVEQVTLSHYAEYTVNIVDKKDCNTCLGFDF